MADTGTVPLPIILETLLSFMAQPERNNRSPDLLQALLNPGGQNGRWGDYALNQEGALPSSCNLPLLSTRMNSLGPNYHSDHGKLEFASCSGFGRSYG